MSTITEILAEFAARGELRAMPNQAVRQVKRCLVDTLGVIFAGSNTESGRIIMGLAQAMNEERTSSIVGSPLRKSCFTAALANAVMAHSLELDDGSRHASYHPGSVVVPAALALGEREEVRGEEFLLAILLGYEISLRIGRAVNPSHITRGFHPTGTVGVFGATVAAAKILQLTIPQFVNALGIAGSLAAGVNEYEVDGSLVKHLHPGRAAQSGILAAELARRGLSAPSTIIEGELGFCKSFSDSYSLDTITEDLGEVFEITKIYFKPYPSCRYVHYAIDATLNLLRQQKIAVDDIDQVIVKTVKLGKRFDVKRLKTPFHAKLSIPYGVAVALTKGRVMLEEHNVANIKDQRILNLMRRVSVVVDPKMEECYPRVRSARVEITTTKGEKFSSQVDHPKGDPENPLSDKELEEKFRNVTSTKLSPKRGDKILKAIESMEILRTVRSFARILRVF